MTIYKSGKKGVCWAKKDKRWDVSFKSKHYGEFKNLEDAIKKREELELQYWGQYEKPILRNTCLQRFCENCGNPTKFNGHDYNRFCSRICSNKSYWDRCRANGHFTEAIKRSLENGARSKKIQGFFNPRNKDKYVGDVKNIIYRSHPELQIMSRLDDNPAVLEWSSEELVINYFDKSSKRMRRYFPDFWVKIKKKDGIIKQLILEYKPIKQTYLPKKPDKNSTRRQKNKYLEEAMIYVTNTCKWQTAEQFAQQNNMKFKIITEKDLLLL